MVTASLGNDSSGQVCSREYPETWRVVSRQPGRGDDTRQLSLGRAPCRAVDARDAELWAYEGVAMGRRHPASNFSFDLPVGGATASTRPSPREHALQPGVARLHPVGHAGRENRVPRLAIRVLDQQSEEGRAILFEQ